MKVAVRKKRNGENVWLAGGVTLLMLPEIVLYNLAGEEVFWVINAVIATVLGVCLLIGWSDLRLRRLRNR